MDIVNLEKLATAIQENFIEVTLDMPAGIGQLTVRVYQTAPPLTWTLSPDRLRPMQPKIAMKRASGRFQMRPSKAGDPEFDAYEIDLAAYEDETDALQDAAALVIPLKDVEYPKDLSKPPASTHEYLQEEYPTHILLRKAWWLKAILLCIPTNYTKVQTAIIKLNAGTDAGRVDEVKKNSVSTSEENELD